MQTRYSFTIDQITEDSLEIAFTNEFGDYVIVEEEEDPWE